MNRILSTLTRIPKYTPRFAFAGDKLKDKDLGDEKVFFTREDQKLMQKLLKKMKDTNEVVKNLNDPGDKEELQNILSRYKVGHNDALVEEILRWKKGD